PASCDLPHLHPFPTRRSSDLLSIVPTASTDTALPARRNCARCSGSPAFHSPAAPRPMLSPSAAAISGLAELTPLSPPSTLNVSRDRKSTRLNSSHRTISYAVF